MKGLEKEGFPMFVVRVSPDYTFSHMLYVFSLLCSSLPAPDAVIFLDLDQDEAEKRGG